MLVLLVALISVLYLGPILIYAISDSVSGIVTILTLILPLVNIVYAIICSKNISNDVEKVRKWNGNVLIIKIALIPFYIINFILWFFVSIIGIVPIFMYLLVFAPMMGFAFTFWIFLSTSFYSVAVIREYYKIGYLTKTLKMVLIISQFLFVWDLVGYVALQLIIKNRVNAVKKLENNC